MNHSSRTRHAWTPALLGLQVTDTQDTERSDAARCLPHITQTPQLGLQAMDGPVPDYPVIPLRAPFILNNLKHPKCVTFFLPFCLCPVHVYTYMIHITKSSDVSPKSGRI